MKRGNALKAQLAARIRASEVKMDVQYAEKRVATVIPAPTVAPVSPLTGPPSSAKLIQTTVTPALPTVVGIPCLWLDAVVATMTPSEQINTKNPVGWKQGADAMARVLVEDTALDSDKPYGRTVFDGCDTIVVQGRSWFLLAVEPIGHSFSAPSTYAVWLRGSVK